MSDEITVLRDDLSALKTAVDARFEQHEQQIRRLISMSEKQLAMMSDTLDMVTMLKGKVQLLEDENQMLKRQLDAVSVQMTELTSELQNAYDGLPGHIQRDPAIQQLFSRADDAIAKVEDKLYNDELTSLHNRTFLNHVLRNASGVYVGMTLDLDKFKQINDQHGHAAGDAVLRQISGIVKKTCSQSADDTRKVHAFRLGGEEIGVLVQCRGTDRSTPQAEAQWIASLAEKIRVAIGETPILNGKPWAVTTSIGISDNLLVLPADPAELMASKTDYWGDGNLYYAKRQGRNQCWGNPQSSIAVQLERLRLASPSADQGNAWGLDNTGPDR